MATKKVTTLNIDDDILSHSKKNPDIKSLSDWICKAYREEFLNIAAEEEAIKNLELELSNRRMRLESLKEKEEALGIPDRLFEWFKQEGLARAERVNDLNALLRWFNNSYGQDLNIKQFRAYLDRAKQEKNKGDLN